MTSIADGLKSGLTILIFGVTPQLSLASIINMRPGVTEMSARIQYIHHIGLWVCVVVGIIVFGAMFYSMFAHRRSRNPEPATFRDSMLVEFVWTLIPVLILIGMAIPATTALRVMNGNSDTEMQAGRRSCLIWKSPPSLLMSATAGATIPATSFNSAAYPRTQIGK